MVTACRLVSLLVVLVAAACAVHAQERIKMCGRDLIRLAVSYCGNPRNRRSLPDADLDQHKTLWSHGSSSEEQQTPQTLHLQSDGEKPPPRTAPRWFSRSFRIRRAAKKVSDICCEEGCSMKELIQFC
ncbi:insulin-like peptide INSL5 [Oryzias latipes]|uniref:insulin-like peptide INSL5 n=1 Tax=Oryzias latipes TaxID=8090 RepID=UPI0002A4CCDB|nr:insulin-like peptide INSL5 [Oryzias latipes]